MQILPNSGKKNPSRFFENEHSQMLGRFIARHSSCIMFNDEELCLCEGWKMRSKLSTPGCSMIALSLALALQGCNTFERLSNVGSGPALSNIEDPRAKPGYQPVSLPMPSPTESRHAPGSLWRSGAQDFFRDNRASKVGDLLTVFVGTAGDAVAIADNSTRQRGAGANANTEHVPIPVLPPSIAGAYQRLFGPAALDIDAAHSGNSGGGAINRADLVVMRLAAMVVQVLPNGNLVINGKQEMKAGLEIRELTIAGVVRPNDIDSNNQISYEKIAEARISYGGKGYLSDVQPPRYGFELLDMILPF
jgi:flagellar L-ring protein FlgH